MSGMTPQQKLPKLIVVVTFDGDEEGTPQVAFGPAEQQSEERAIRTAKALVSKHAGVLAWTREANPAIGEYGEPAVLFQHGRIGEME